MRHALLATTILVSATVALATAGGASSSTAGRCYAKEATIKGKSVIVNCGPASGTLRYKGKDLPVQVRHMRPDGRLGHA